MSDVKIAKLVTGEIVIGKKTETHLTDCIQVRPLPKDGGFEIAMAPLFPMMSDEFVNFELKYIMTDATPSKELENKYLESITGLVMPGNITSMRRR